MVKRIEVACAIISRGDDLLIAQRKPDVHLGGYWEFPGGKREEKESWEDCLIREAYEELGVEIRPRKLFREVIHTYPEKEIHLCFYFCDWVSGEPSKKDCQDFRWIKVKEVWDYRFLPADIDILQELTRNEALYFKR